MKEAWENIYNIQDIKKIQKIELESLRVLKELCSKLDIKFFLYGGTLLGAVKYGGFIPWDDDLDIALMRNDYEKLLLEGSSLLPDNYEIQHPMINSRTPYPYMKFRRTDTKMVEYIFRNVKINHGVYIDIYPIDNLPDDDIEIEKDMKKILKLSLALQRKQTISISQPIKSIIRFVQQLVEINKYLVFKFVPQKYIVKKMNKIMTKYNKINTRRQGNLFFPYPVNYFDGIFPLISVKFEGIDVYIPKGYEINLKNRYGDISILPAKEKRFGHKPYLLELDYGKEK